jgi:hypothetical protein
LSAAAGSAVVCAQAVLPDRKAIWAIAAAIAVFLKVLNYVSPNIYVIGCYNSTSTSPALIGSGNLTLDVIRYHTRLYKTLQRYKFWYEHNNFRRCDAAKACAAKSFFSFGKNGGGRLRAAAGRASSKYLFTIFVSAHIFLASGLRMGLACLLKFQ